MLAIVCEGSVGRIFLELARCIVRRMFSLTCSVTIVFNFVGHFAAAQQPEAWYTNHPRVSLDNISLQPNCCLPTRCPVAVTVDKAEFAQSFPAHLGGGLMMITESLGDFENRAWATSRRDGEVCVVELIRSPTLPAPNSELRSVIQVTDLPPLHGKAGTLTVVLSADQPTQFGFAEVRAVAGGQSLATSFSELSDEKRKISVRIPPIINGSQIDILFRWSLNSGFTYPARIYVKDILIALESS